MWAAMDDRELLDNSELVVMGAWQAAPPQRPAGSEGFELGRIAVSEVLKGPADLCQVWVVLPGNPQLRSSSDLNYRPGDRGLWLLRRHPGGKSFYLADHPQRFVPAQGGEARIQQLRRLLGR